jgi:hypothetical protein
MGKIDILVFSAQYNLMEWNVINIGSYCTISSNFLLCKYKIAPITREVQF